jgi:SecY interacting protein Syd
MKTTSCALQQNIINFSQHYVEVYQQAHAHLPLVEVDEQWQSPCLQGEHDDNTMLWQPQIIEEELSFDNIEQALDITIHQDICSYYTAIYSESLHATCSEGQLSLLFSWCKEDFSRLQENIIGHILMKQKLKQPISIFFAVTDDEDFILSVNNDNGEVWVERVGCVPHKKVADNLTDFIETLEPYVDF